MNPSTHRVHTITLWMTVAVALMFAGCGKPQSGGELYRQGKAAMEKGDNPEAIKLFERALLADPKHHDAHYRVGKLYLDAGKKGPALKHLEAAAALLPTDPKTQFRLGEAYLANHKNAEA